MSVTAKRAGRILVWPDSETAEAADTEDSKHDDSCRRMTVWQTISEAEENIVFSDAPEWVPDGAKIHIDLATDRAWTEADGEVAIDVLLGSDTNTENAYGATQYTPENIVPGEGLQGTIESRTVAFIGDARAAVTSGSTIVVRTKDSDLAYYIMSAAGNKAIFTECVQGRHPRQATSGSYFSGHGNLISQDNVMNVGEDVLNVAAVTVTPTRVEFAVCGNAAGSAALTTDDWPEGQLVASLLDWGGLLQAITIYDPLPDTGGLSELSEVA